MNGYDKNKEVFCVNCNKAIKGKVGGIKFNLSHLKVGEDRRHHDCFRLFIMQLEDGQSYGSIEQIGANSL